MILRIGCAGGAGGGVTGGAGRSGAATVGCAGGAGAASVGVAAGVRTGGAGGAGGAGMAAGGFTSGRGGGATTLGAGVVGAGVVVGAAVFGASGLAAGATGVAGLATGFVATGAAGAGLAAGGGGAGASTFLRIAAKTSPGFEIFERSILVLISSAPPREVLSSLLAAPLPCPEKCRRTRSASSSSSELEWVFFSVTPTCGRTSRIALLLTSSSLAKSLIRILLIRLLVSPIFPLSVHCYPHGSLFSIQHSNYLGHD